MSENRSFFRMYLLSAANSNGTAKEFMRFFFRLKHFKKTIAWPWIWRQEKDAWCWRRTHRFPSKL